MFQRREFRFIFGWVLRPVIIALLVVAFSVMHSRHVSTMFENDTHFSHLTTLEREMIFRSEMGMYFSYYKRLVQAPTYLDGLIDIINDRKTEYPSVINSLQRFNLFPEVVIAALYRMATWISEVLELTNVDCWVVQRSCDDAFTTCMGYGEPITFYLYAVWACAGLTMSLIFLFGLELSGSILGGSFAVLCFMFNHSECTRIQWTPPLRESFGYPCALWQMLTVTKFLRFAASSKGMLRNQQSLTNWLSNISRLMLPTTLFLVLWQFSQFVITTQLLAVYLLYCFGVIGRQTCLTLAISVAGSVVVASVILFFNEFLLYSTLTFLAMSMVVVLHLEPLFQRTKLTCAALSALIAVLTLLLKRKYGNRDDSHILNLLRAKLTDYKDFHTLLYTCSLEFDFMPVSYVRTISETLLLPTAVFNVIAVTGYWFMKAFHSYKRSPRVGVRSFVDPAIAYNFLQANAFAVMAALIMRLKLFLTPHLCLIASIIFHKQFLPSTPKQWFSAFFALLLGGMAVQGYANIVHERSIIGEFTNAPLEELLTWIVDETDTNAVFAGPMPVVGNIMLSTDRPVVNHPHYERAEARDSTLKVYSIFSRKSPFEVYNMMVKMNVQYVVIENVWCFGVSKKGCSMGDLWDIQDPENMNQDLLCPALYKMSAFPFNRRFSNGVFAVLKVDPQWSNSKYPKAIKIDPMNIVNIAMSQNS